MKNRSGVIKYFSLLLKAVLAVYVVCIVSMGCANMGAGPQGGPVDSVPPVMLHSIPQNGQTNYYKKNMEIVFDEIVKVNNAYEKVIVSPPQQTPVVVKSAGRKVTVEFSDTLQQNTSYTVDFSDAIVDNNEGNALENFSLSFSTGTYIDSLMIGGIVLDASNLNPVAGAIVGIHSDMNDSAFVKKVFERITKSDNKGYFTIKNIRPDDYHVFAINDIGNNFRFDMPNERIAFIDSIYTPQVSSVFYMDTILNDSLLKIFADSIRVDTIPISQLPVELIDTIVKRETFEYTPDNLILLAFEEKQKGRQYLLKNERKERYRFVLYFAQPLDSLPYIEGLNFDYDSVVTLQKSANNDTLIYWIKDTIIAAMDTLSMTINYRNTDSLGILGWKQDTLNIAYRGPKNQERTGRLGRKQEKRKEFMSISSNAGSKFNVYDRLELSFPIPSRPVDSIKCYVEQKVDTLWQFVTDSLYRLDSIGLKYRFDFIPQPESEYRVSIDSAKFISIIGLHNDSTGFSLKVRSLQEYGKLIVKLSDVYTGKEVLQLLNDKDEPIRIQKAVNEEIVFEYLDPGTYYLRLFIDDNNDGVWTTGEYVSHRQAESVYYFPYSINVRAMWDVEEIWNYKELPLIEQKPLELIKENKTNK